MEKSRSSNIQEMKFALVHKSSNSFCNTLKLNDKTFAGFQIYKNVPLPESTLTWGENWRRWKNAGGKIPWIQNARYLSCIFQSCKMMYLQWHIYAQNKTPAKYSLANVFHSRECSRMKDLEMCPWQMLQDRYMNMRNMLIWYFCNNTNLWGVIRNTEPIAKKLKRDDRMTPDHFRKYPILLGTFYKSGDAVWKSNKNIRPL